MSSAYTACASSGLYIRFEHCLWLSCFLLQWPVLLAIAGVAPAIWLPSFTYCISSAFCSSSTSRSSLAPHVLRHMLSAAVHATISRFACIRYSVLLLQPTPTLPLIESPHSFSVFNNSNPQCIGISHTNKSGTAAKGLLYFIQNTIPKEDYSSTAVNSKI